MLLSTSQAQAPVRLGCEVGWVGNAKVLLDVAVCVAWCHVARKIMATAGPFCRWSSRPALESNQGMTGAPGSANFGQISLKLAIVDNKINGADF